jgi:hypothetical protein
VNVRLLNIEKDIVLEQANIEYLLGKINWPFKC